MNRNSHLKGEGLSRVAGYEAMSKRRTTTTKLMAHALIAPAGLGPSLARYLQERTGCCKTAAYKYATMRTGILPMAERNRLIEEARLARLAEEDSPDLSPETLKELQRAEQDAGYASVYRS